MPDYFLDPWADGILTIASVEPWSVWLRAGLAST